MPRIRGWTRFAYLRRLRTHHSCDHVCFNLRLKDVDVGLLTTKGPRWGIRGASQDRTGSGFRASNRTCLRLLVFRIPKPTTRSRWGTQNEDIRTSRSRRCRSMGGRPSSRTSPRWPGRWGRAKVRGHRLSLGLLQASLPCLLLLQNAAQIVLLPLKS